MPPPEVVRRRVRAALDEGCPGLIGHASAEVISGLTLNGRSEGRLPRWRCRVRVETFYADMYDTCDGGFLADAGESIVNLVLLAAVGGLGLFILSFFGEAAVTAADASKELAMKLDAQDKAAGRPRAAKPSGPVFDSSYARGSPTTFAPNQVIKG